MLAADRPLHERYVHVVGKLFTIYQRAVDKLNRLGKRQQSLVDIKERHMAAGASVQPNGCHLCACHFSLSLSRSVASVIRKPRCFSISPTDVPFTNSAPVGHTCTHL